MRRLLLTLIVLLTAINSGLYAQLAECGPDVPYYYVDLTGSPEGTWISPSHSRQDNCCGTTAPDNCTSFEVVLDSNAAALSFDIFSGAIPTGSMFFQIDCGPPIPVGEMICLAGVGPHHVTFCKPGNNTNQYIIKSIAAPTFPSDDTTRDGCSKTLSVLGLEPTTVTWNTIFPGTYGEYNNLLSCTDSCTTSTLTPETPGLTPYYDIEICGFPVADECGYVLTICDTVRIYMTDSLIGSVDPNPGSFCMTGPGSGVTLTASATGGDTYYEYIWYDSSGAVVGTGSTYYATAQQTYSVEISDGISSGECSNEYVSVPVVQTPIPVVNAGLDQVPCATAPTVTLSGSVENAMGGVWSGGLGTYSPDDSSTVITYTPTIAEMESGSVTLTLTSYGAGGSCPEVTDDVIIYYPDTIDIGLTDAATACAGDILTLNPPVSGGNGPYDYFWSTGETSSSIDVGEGTYCLTIIDALGCEMENCATVTSPDPITLSMSSTPTSTDGGSDGTATAVPSGGTSPYTYSWSPSGGTASVATGLSYGIYVVTVTDDNGCSVTGSVVVNKPSCAGFDVSIADTSVSCFGDETAEVTAVLTGGTGPYDYLWDDPSGQTTPTATGLGAGVYTVTIVDDNLCLAVATVIVSEPEALTNTMTWTNATTVGGTDGDATANISGGTPGYDYLWSTAETTAGISGLSAGVYYLTVTDTNGCTLIDSVKINEPPCTGMTIYLEGESVSCNDGTDGEAIVHIIGGVAPFDILWSTASDNDTISDLSAGDYSVTVSDFENCTSFATLTITEPSPLSTGTDYQDISCWGETDGTIDLTVSGGTYPYTFAWSNSETTEDLVFLEEDTYYVTVTDANGCTAVDSATITEPEVLNTTYTSTNVSCWGLDDGSIDITVTGGVGPIYYLWSNDSTSQDISDLTAALYWVSVTDANGCFSDEYINILITQPDSLIATAAVSSDYNGYDVSCAGGNDGTVDLSVIGGTTPYTYSWTNSETTEDLAGLAAGEYAVLVTDSLGCSDSAYVSLTEPDSLDLSHTQVNVTCNGFYNGSIDLTVSGGVPAYSYLWSNSETTEDITAIGAGSYTVVVTDLNGCIDSLSTDIVEEDPVIISSTMTHVSCYQLADGAIDLSISGGVSPYEFLWNTTATTEDLSGLTSGTYSVQVEDQNGCTSVDTFIVAQPDLLTVNLSSTVYFNGHNVTLYQATDGEIDAVVAGGTSPYEYIWSNGSSTEDLSGVGAGTYIIEVTDFNGCYATDTIKLTEPYALEIPTVVTDNSDGKNDFLLIHGLESYPDNQLSIYNRWGNLVWEMKNYDNQWHGQNEQGDLLPTGTYFVILKIEGEEPLEGFVEVKR